MILSLADLTEPVLRRLYYDEGKTETEIAVLYSTYQVMVGRVRKRYGIPTIGKTDRLDLPTELTARQKSILVGSMLGDGRLFKTGSETAAYSEHHSEKQRPYLEWKASEFEPFTKGITPSNKGPHLGNLMTTHGVRVLKPYWDLFYPQGKGSKGFSNLPLKWVDALALAVWFMDDGSKSGKCLRFSVSPDLKDVEVQLKVFQKLGLDAHFYQEKNGNTIFISDRTNLTRFMDLVRPHIHPSLSYKLDLDPRSLGDAPRDVLTSDRLKSFTSKGMSAGGIAQTLRVSRQSVIRALRREGLTVLSPGRPSKSDSSLLSEEEATLALSRLDATSPTYVADATEVLLKASIPLPEYTPEKLLQDIRLLRTAKTTLKDGVFEGVTRAGAWLCQESFSYRWDARYRQNPSVREAWHDPKYLGKAVKFQVGVGDPVLPHRILRALQAVVRAPTNFRPCFAKAIVEALCPEGGLVLDPCAGYGGRAAGTLAANRSYVGVDPHPLAPQAYARLQQHLGGEFQFHNQPYEDVELSTQADLVFTSPPYFSVERYADDSSQSWVRYPTWDSWVAGFLQPLVFKSWDHLKPGGAMAINTKNVRIGRQVYPIADKLKEYALEVGFKLEAEWTLPLGFLGKVKSVEPLLVFRKPGA